MRTQACALCVRFFFLGRCVFSCSYLAPARMLRADDKIGKHRRLRGVMHVCARARVNFSLGMCTCTVQYSTRMKCTRKNAKARGPGINQNVLCLFAEPSRRSCAPSTIDA